jgi:hypothetical protein
VELEDGERDYSVFIFPLVLEDVGGEGPGRLRTGDAGQRQR